MTLFLRESVKIENNESAKFISYSRLAANGEADDVKEVLEGLTAEK